MGLRPVSVHAVLPAREHVGSTFASADCGSARGPETGDGSVAAAGAEFDDLAPLSSSDDARGFARDHGLETQRSEEVRLHDLAFDDGSSHAHHGFAREDQCSFGDGANVPGETECAEVVEEFVVNVAK